MSKIAVDIEVDIDQFDTDDLVEELTNRNDFDKSDLKKLKNIISENSGEFDNIKIESLTDKMKLELVINNFHKKSLSDFEAFFTPSV